MRYIRPMKMQMGKTIFATNFAAPEEVPEFKLVIAYEDFAHGQYAIKFFEWIVAKFGDLFTFIPHFLQFEELLGPQVRERITRELTDTSMVVIAANEDADLPLLVTDWLRSWETVNIGNESALVALLSFYQDNRSRRSSVRSQLERVARRTGMKFFCKPIDWPRDDNRQPAEVFPQCVRGGLFNED
jgi:hypothetical protein